MENKINIKLGILSFLLGLILLIITFIIGYHILTDETYYISKKIIEADLVKGFSHWFMKTSTMVVVLIIMTIIGSCLTNKGISLLFTNKK